MTIALALYQPDIPQNAGTLMRLGACLDIEVHLIHPTGFLFSQKAFRRAGMDYLDQVNLVEHNSFDAFNIWRTEQNRRLVLLTTKSTQSHVDIKFKDTDILMVGRESVGVPEDVAAAADIGIRIPMRQETRSLNVAIAGAIVLSEAAQQTKLWANLT